MISSRVVIFGVGGLGREVAGMLIDVATKGSTSEPVGFLVDTGYDAPSKIHGLPVWHDTKAIFRDDPDLTMVVALGNPSQRANVVRRVEAEVGPRFATLIDPRAIIGGTVTVGAGSIIFGLCSITANVSLGSHVLVNPGVTIAHDCTVGDFVSIGPNAAIAGGVVIEDGVELGVGARVIPRCHLGRRSLVGAGAVVIHDVKAEQTVVGVPARVLT